MNIFLLIFLICYISVLNAQESKISASKQCSGNPLFEGWYADPEGIIFGNQYWIYPTYSDDFGKDDRSEVISQEQINLQKNTINPQYLKQTFINAFSSEDLVSWKKHPHIIDIKDVKWAAYSIWAPSIIKATLQCRKNE